MAETNAFPPHRLLSSRAVSSEEALQIISQYLEAAENDASLQPNALLTEGGPVPAMQGVSMGLVLHNLKRVQAGLRGEHLSADPSGEVGENGSTFEGEPTNSELQAAQGAAVEEGSREAFTMSDEWQDKGEFEREQEIEQGTVEDQIPAIVDTATDQVNEPVVESLPSTSDKLLKKQQRKQKRLQEKRKKKVDAKERKSRLEDEES